jgi:hypothetical protein
MIADLEAQTAYRKNCQRRESAAVLVEKFDGGPNRPIRRSLLSPFLWAFAKADAGATAVFIDEFDAADSKARRTATSFGTVIDVSLSASSARARSARK